MHHLVLLLALVLLRPAIGAAAEDSIALDLEQVSIHRASGTSSRFSRVHVAKNGDVTAEKGQFRIKNAAQTVTGHVTQINGNTAHQQWRFLDLVTYLQAARIQFSTGVIDLEDQTIDGADGVHMQSDKLYVQSISGTVNLAGQSALLTGQVSGRVTP